MKTNTRSQSPKSLSNPDMMGVFVYFIKKEVETGETKNRAMLIY